MKKPSRWIIVSNRLPFALNKKTGKVGVSSGGLVTAISGIVNTHTEKVWVGSAESSLSREKIKEASQKDKKFTDYIPIYINDSDYDAYYNHISNDVLWPLFHYESHISKFNWKEWESYEKVNLLFAKKNSRDIPGRRPDLDTRLSFIFGSPVPERSTREYPDRFFSAHTISQFGIAKTTTSRGANTQGHFGSRPDRIS